MLLIFFLTKKNFRGAIVVLVIVVAMNISIYKRTDGKSWTITIEPPATANSSDGYGYQDKPEPITMTFSVHKNWTITDAQGEVHHWCWVDEYWDKFAKTDVIASIWGTNSSKKMMNSTESRTNVDQ